MLKVSFCTVLTLNDENTKAFETFFSPNKFRLDPNGEDLTID